MLDCQRCGNPSALPSRGRLLIKIPSLTFGEIEIDEETIYTFKDGVPGLKGIHKYCIVESDELAPFKWLQACEEPFLSMMMLDPTLIDPEYDFTLSDEYNQVLDIEETDELTAMVFIVVPQDPKKMTANLLAPVVFNARSKRGVQVVIEGTQEMLRVKVIKN